MLLAIHLLTAALFLLLGAAFAKGKGAWLIAGYNTSSPGKKAKYDEKALCGFMGKLMFAFAACFLVIAAGELFHREALLWVGLGLFFAAAIAAVVYANTGSRFKK